MYICYLQPSGLRWRHIAWLPRTDCYNYSPPNSSEKERNLLLRGQWWPRKAEPAVLEIGDYAGLTLSIAMEFPFPYLVRTHYQHTLTLIGDPGQTATIRLWAFINFYIKYLQSVFLYFPLFKISLGTTGLNCQRFFSDICNSAFFKIISSN